MQIKRNLTNTTTNYNKNIYAKSVLIYNNYSKLETNITIIREAFKLVLKAATDGEFLISL